MTKTTGRLCTEPRVLREEALHLAERLETLALKKEKVLACLDVGGAKRARALVVALRGVSRLEDPEVLRALGDLRRRALPLLEGS